MGWGRGKDEERELEGRVFKTAEDVYNDLYAFSAVLNTLPSNSLLCVSFFVLSMVL
jgi:hypothetical protein